MTVKAKKHLGQHFLTDQSIAQNIANLLKSTTSDLILEIGPGTGVLTKYLTAFEPKLYLVEIDPESVEYLKAHYLGLAERIIERDILKLDLAALFPKQSISMIGNYPYNISTQIVFKMLEYKSLIPEMAGMFQKEVAERICAQPGSKVYGILSVLTQAFYHCSYEFTVPPHVFNPPPRVESGVIHLKRKEDFTLGCNEALFFKVVKTAFQQRRKTLRNSLKTFELSDNLKEGSIFDKRPEQLSVQEFTSLTSLLQGDT